MKSSSMKWIEAAKLLNVNPNVKVICPECDQQNLNVVDALIEYFN